MGGRGGLGQEILTYEGRCNRTDAPLREPPLKREPLPWFSSKYVSVLGRAGHRDSFVVFKRAQPKDHEDSLGHWLTSGELGNLRVCGLGVGFGGFRPFRA